VTQLIGIIPTRTGSQRVPNKNFRTFVNKPLVLHSLEQAIACKDLDRVVVSTNHPDLSGIIPSAYLPYFIKRPDGISDAKAKGYLYVAHALKYCKEKFSEDFSHFVVLPPTGPLRTTSDISACINKLLSKNCDTVTSMVEVNMMYHGFKQKKILEQDKVTPFLIEENGRSAYHELPKAYVRNCAIYASKVQVIENKTLIGKDCRAYIMPPEKSVDINDPIDFEFAEFLYQTKKS
jgi:CMP-N,N'-diacetyllegionaminic acid synthase